VKPVVRCLVPEVFQGPHLHIPQDCIHCINCLLAFLIHPITEISVPSESRGMGLEAPATLKMKEHLVEAHRLCEASPNIFDYACYLIQLLSPPRIDNARLAKGTLEDGAVSCLPVSGIERKEGVLHRFVKVDEAQLAVKVRSEGRAIQALGKESDELLVFPPLGTAGLPFTFLRGQVNGSFAMFPQFCRGVDSCRPPRGIVDVNFVVTWRAEGNTILYPVVARHDVMNLDTMEVSTYAATPAAIGQELL